MIYKLKNIDGSVSIMNIINTNTTVEKEIEKLNFKVEKFDEIKESDIPKSKNYRNAWNYDLNVDLEKAKPLQRKLMIQKMHERVAVDEFGEKDLNEIKSEILAINVYDAKTIDELYNMWPKSIEIRTDPRSYKENL